jgi:hypothetical protein
VPGPCWTAPLVGVVRVEVVVVEVEVEVVGVEVVFVVVVDERVAVVVLLLVIVCVAMPITIVTVEPRGRREPPGGFWAITVLLRLGSLTGRVVVATSKPWERSALAAPADGSPVTGGTVAVGCALATTIVTVEPGRAGRGRRGHLMLAVDLEARV